MDNLIHHLNELEKEEEQKKKILNSAEGKKHENQRQNKIEI